MDVQKQKTPQGHRFVIETEAGEAELTLARVSERVFNANHTFTPRALRGQGVAGNSTTPWSPTRKQKDIRLSLAARILK